jgi:DNA primase catalytic subunit
MNDTTRFNFLKQHFLGYYREHAKSLNAPLSMNEREFGFLTFHERRMIRHKAFKDLESFNGALLSLTPSDVYYSTAYYERPDADMAGKGWLGADIVFDVDADHLDAFSDFSIESFTGLWESLATKYGQRLLRGEVSYGDQQRLRMAELFEHAGRTISPSQAFLYAVAAASS